jgi:hypothetical protein
MNRLRELDELQRISALFKQHPGIQTPPCFVTSLRELMDSGQFQLFSRQ